MPRAVLGLNSAYHESSAAVVVDGEVVMAVEEERLTRVKRGKPARVDNPDELPWRAIQACLDRADLRLQDLEAVGYSLQPGRRLAMIDADEGRADPAQGFGTREGEEEFDRRVRALPDLLAARGAARFRHLPHHLCHAAHAYFSSPFEEAAVLVVDGIGEDCTTWLGRGRGQQLEILEEVPYPHSLGFLWERLCGYLGFSEYDAGKVMGLAAFGDPSPFRREFEQLVPISGDAFQVDGATVGFRCAGYRALESLLGPRRRPEERPDRGRFADVAAALQRRSEDALLATARRLHRLAPSRRLAYAGGVALNCVANARLAREGPFEELYIPGAAHDGGTALGAAWLLQPPERRAGGLGASPFLGPSWTDAEIQASLIRHGVEVHETSDPAAAAAELLSRGEVVGWFQGALEFGPRALGHRSLLADPRDPEVPLRLNIQVKHREPFRPFAASVLAERASEWFDFDPGTAPAGDLMLFTWPARPERAERIPAVLHCDGSCRPQWVHPERDPLYHRLLSEFEARTGIPMVLNTSFNDQEPIVASPDDAVKTCRHAGIRNLVIGRFAVRPCGGSS